MGSALARAGRWLGRGALHWLRHWPVRKIVILGCACLVLLGGAAAGTGYEMLRHFNANLVQDNISGLLGAQPVNTHPQAENIVVIGSDTRSGQGRGYGTGLVTDQSDTLMIVHIPADRKWAEVMSIPRDSYVSIPACTMGNGQLSAPTQFKINEAFALGNLHGNRTALGIACTIKTVEQDTGIYISHFIAVNFAGFKSMVAALGGVSECNPTAINDPHAHLRLSAGQHLLTPTQALGYVRARYSLGDGSDLERIGRQQVFMSSLVSRVKSRLYNPLDIYRFLDAFTRSLTIDKQLGGITGLYDLGQSLRGIPSSKIAFFTIPNVPRSEFVPADLANVVWTQPEDSKIFASFRNDVPASSTLFAATARSTLRHPAGSPGGSTAAKAARKTASPATARAALTPAAGPGAPPSASPVPIRARTVNQSICAG